jgi:ribose transport system ATP-binding protein
MVGIEKRFGATRALAEATLELRGGEVHALVGENGAGKSTLMKVLSGVHGPDAGSMELDGRRFAPRSIAEARSSKVAMIFQELAIAPDLSVVANVHLGRERSRAGVLRRREERRLAAAALARLGHADLDLELRAGDLPLALQQIVEIARALASEARVIVFDEPTSSLGEADARRLVAVARELAQQGLAIVWISHFLEEVRAVADRFSVLRDGALVKSGTLARTATAEIVEAMAGRRVEEMFPRVPHAPGEVLLEVRELCGIRAPRNVSLTLRRGEIVGLFGLLGAGRSELLRCVFGLAPVRSGSVSVAHLGTGALAVGASPRASLARRLGFVSEDRKGEGLALELSIEDNLTLSHLAPYTRGGWLALGKRSAAAWSWMQRVGCKAQGPQQRTAELSGGNQQKIALARLLHQDAEVLLLDEPTRGIDVGTKSELYRSMGELAAEGRAILFASSYLPEVLSISDRVGVLCRGELVALRDAAEFSESEIMHLATGGAAA